MQYAGTIGTGSAKAIPATVSEGLGDLENAISDAFSALGELESRIGVGLTPVAQQPPGIDKVKDSPTNIFDRVQNCRTRINQLRQATIDLASRVQL